MQHNRYRWLCLVSCVTLFSVGCRQDMQDQPKFFPQRGTSFYADGRSVRPQVAGTVARSQVDENTYFETGLIKGEEGDGLPLDLTPALIHRGQERFNIYCAPCHARTGNGKGMIVERGYYPAANLHTERLRSAPLGHFFSVMTDGYGAMPNYRAELSPTDRWAVAAYIRALQLSQHARQEDVPPGQDVKPLHTVLEKSGFSADFLDTWLKSARNAPPAPPASPAPMAVTTTATPTGTPTSSATGPQQVATVPRQPATPVAPKAPVKIGDAGHGQTIYSSDCAMCHQESLEGRPPRIPSLLGIIDKVGAARVREVAHDGIPDGKPPMPAHADLTDDDLNDLIAFLKKKQ